MDTIAAINIRMTEIRGAVTAMSPSRSEAATSAGSFASVLATEVARQVGGATGASRTTSTGGADAMFPSVQKVGGYGPDRLANAAAIIDAAKALGLSVRDQTIGVMTAMGESSLTVADHGDTAGPDSRGLFQQRANGAWGSLADRMDPTVSATSFFTKLAGVQGRDSLAPTLVAHVVQRNADPQHYAKYWDDAVAVVTRLTGASTSGPPSR